MPKLKRNKHELNLKHIQSAPPKDEYITGFQTRPILILDDNSPLLTSLMIVKPTLQAVLQPPQLLKPTEDNTSDGETPVSQVTPLLGTTPSKNSQLKHKKKLYNR